MAVTYQMWNQDASCKNHQISTKFCYFLSKVPDIVKLGWCLYNICEFSDCIMYLSCRKLAKDNCNGGDMRIGDTTKILLITSIYTILMF